MYRLIIESLLGLRLEIDKLRFVPRLPATWKSFKIHYRYRETFYHITISSPSGAHEVKRVVVDGDARADGCVLLMDDRKDHQVTVELG
jgi:cellobiose phosphorylase